MRTMCRGSFLQKKALWIYKILSNIIFFLLFSFNFQKNPTLLFIISHYNLFFQLTIYSHFLLNFHCFVFLFLFVSLSFSLFLSLMFILVRKSVKIGCPRPAGRRFQHLEEPVDRPIKTESSIVKGDFLLFKMDSTRPIITPTLIHFFIPFSSSSFFHLFSPISFVFSTYFQR